MVSEYQVFRIAQAIFDPASSMVGSNMLVIIAAAIVYLLLCR